MEELSYVNFFKFISNQKLRVPVLETCIIQNNFIDCIVCNDEQGYIKRRNILKPYSALSYLQKLIEENELKLKLSRHQTDKICYFYKKGKKKLIEISKIKEIRSFSFLNIDMIQKPVQTINNSEKLYSLKLCYINGHYWSEFKSGKSSVTDPIIINIMQDIAIVVINSLEQSLIKRVLQLYIDFVKDKEGVLWISNIPKCLMIEPRLTLIHNITSEDDIEILTKSIQKHPKSLAQLKKPFRENKYYEINRPMKKIIEESYTFRRGQLRNIRSNLESPIRFNSVEPALDEISDSPDYSKGELENKPIINAFPSVSLDPSYYPKPQLENPEKLNVVEYFKDFLSTKLLDKEKQNIKSSESFFNLKDLSERRPSVRSPVDLQKKKTITRRAHPTIKTVPKAARQPKRMYGSDFMELVIKTFSKNKPTNQDNLSEEFGMNPQISSEQFTQFLNSVDLTESLRSRFGNKGFEDHLESRASTPKDPYPRKRLELHFVSSILAKRKDLLHRAPQTPKANTLINLLISSPRSKRQFGFTKEPNY